ncbi:MAG: ECF transporter S component [Clostridiales bacterium]|nr:ECF transporter S component [Clostridiales bacterium]
MKKNHILRLTLSAMFLAIGFALPFLTGQIPQVGSMLLPMHLPALICGFVCGWPWGLAVGFVMPILRSLLFGMPPMIPTALAMAFEMGAYGAVAGWLYHKLPRGVAYIYASLVGAMLLGRAVWGLASWAIYALLTDNSFALAAFWTGGFVRAWPGIVLQLVLVPLIVLALEKAKLIPLKDK